MQNYIYSICDYFRDEDGLFNRINFFTTVELKYDKIVRLFILQPKIILSNIVPICTKKAVPLWNQQRRTHKVNLQR
jgi:hypothetical protein